MSQLDLFNLSAPRPSAGGPREDIAVFSPCGKYRFLLTRELGGERVCLFIGCNPSVANAVKNDPTMTKDVGFATRWGCGRVVKVNPYAFITPFPSEMMRAKKAGIDIVGADNDRAIREAIALVRETDGICVMACGNNVPLDRIRDVLAMVTAAGVQPMCLGTNQNGSPEHTLYLPYATKLRPFGGL